MAYADFCKKIGFSSIKEFEGNSLREMNDQISRQESLKATIKKCETEISLIDADTSSEAALMKLKESIATEHKRLDDLMNENLAS